MKRLTVDQVRDLLPDVEELRPLVDRVLADSEADPGQEWTKSGELSTAGSRLVTTEALERDATGLAEREHEHLSRIYSLAASALRLAESGDREGAARALLEAAALEEARDRPRRAASYAHSAFRIARGAARPELAGLALRRKARGSWTAGSLGDAERDYARACQMSEVIGDARGAAEAAIGAGNVLWDQGRWELAENWYRRALTALDTLEAPSPERWQALLNLHISLRSKGALEESFAVLDSARAIAEELQDASAEQFLRNALGQWLMARGSFNEAVDALRSGLEASTSARATVTIRLNLAEALFASGRDIEATEEVRRAEREAIAAGLERKLPEVYRLLGRMAAFHDNPDAFVLFERALEIIDARGLPLLERAITLQAYAEAEARLGATETAESLRDQAAEAYRQLGIEQRRSEWADHYVVPDARDDEAKG